MLRSCRHAERNGVGRRPSIHGEGELAEFDDSSFDYRRQVWVQIEAQRQAAGYKAGWSYYRFFDRFGVAPVEGMEAVVLTEVHFLWGGSHNEREIRKADDIFAAYKDRGRTFPAKAPIIKACFRVTFSDSDTPRTVTIKPPNVAQYTRDADSVIVVGPGAQKSSRSLPRGPFS